MAINTEIPLSEKETQVYKKFVNLSVNEEPKPQGEGTIKISPFDDYFIFTIFDETDGVNTPIDLSNVGTLYMVFVGENDEIRISNYTDVQNVDMAAGQILFRIDGDALVISIDNAYFEPSDATTPDALYKKVAHTTFCGIHIFQNSNFPKKPANFNARNIVSYGFDGAANFVKNENRVQPSLGRNQPL